MKTLFTLIIFCITLNLSAQTYSELDRQTVKFYADGKVKEVCNYYSFPSNVYYVYWFQYNTNGRLTSASQHTYQGFGKPWYNPPDSTDIDFKFTYSYNANGRIAEERYYNNYRSLETRCLYNYQGDSALTVTRYDGWDKTIENKTVFNLHIIPEIKDIRPRSTYVELYEKSYFDSLNKLIRKVKYNYGEQQPQSGGLNPHYGQYSALYLHSIQVFDKKNKLLQERKRIKISEEDDGYAEYLDTTIVYVTDDEYSVEMEDYYTGTNFQELGYDEDANPRVLDYLNCTFDSRNKIRNTCMYWDQSPYCGVKIEDMMEITVADLAPGHVEVKD